MPTTNVYSPNPDPVEMGYYIEADEPQGNNIRARQARQAMIINNRARQTKANDMREQEARMEVDGISKGSFSRELIKLGSKILNPYFDYNKCGTADRGTFTYTIVKKYQNYRLDISNYSEAILSAAILTRRDLIDFNKLPAVYKKVYNIFEDAEVNSDDFNMLFYSKFKRWVTMKQKGFGGKYLNITEKDGRIISAINPLTNRKIKASAKTYKQIFGKIPLMSKIDNKYDDLCLYKTEDYDVGDFCVPSYLKKKLKVKEYKKISDYFTNTPTPNYFQLTEVLNSIDYGLDVYITDEAECIQKQETFDKYISIMIHVNHMYVLKTNNRNIIKKDKNLIKESLHIEDFERLTAGEMYTSGSKTVNGIKYKCDNHYRKIEDRFNLMSSFSQNNIDFFNDSNIRPVRYFNMTVKNVQGLDLNKCYPNILRNPKYIFPKQNGTEKIEAYDKELKSHGFYYINLKDRTDIEIALFGKDKYFWTLGYVINHMKLKKRSTIICQMIANDSTYFISDKDFYGSDKIKCDVSSDNTGLTLYSGYLAKYEYDKTKHLRCDGLEKDAYLKKYENDGGCASKGYIVYIAKIEKEGKIKEVLRTKMYKDDEDRQKLLNKIKTLGCEIDYESKPTVSISSTYYKKSCGLYVYLAILQYARFQIWHVYNEVRKISKDANIKKIYTDSISFDVPLTEKQEDKINKNLEEYGFSVKLERTSYEWNNTPSIPIEPKINITELIDNDDINLLLNNNKSFCIDSFAGYGKTHLIQHTIIPYINEHNKKYVLTTTTDESLKLYNGFECNTLQSVLSSKDTTLFTLKKKFKDVDYLIIDECSYIQMHLLNMLQYVKRISPNLRIILAGDINQCTFGLNLMKTDVFYDLVDGNTHTIQYHDKCRYNKEYDNFLKGLLEFNNNDSKRMNYIKQYFSKQIKKDGNKDDNEIKLTWTHAKGKTLCNYMTVHSVQGQTLSNYSIYEIDRMDISILYTALSRAKDPKLINIFL